MSDRSPDTIDRSDVLPASARRRARERIVAHRQIVCTPAPRPGPPFILEQGRFVIADPGGPRRMAA